MLDNILLWEKKIIVLEEVMYEFYVDVDIGFVWEVVYVEFGRLRVFRLRLLILGLLGMG